MTTPAARPLADQVHELLEATANLTVFRGEAGEPVMGEDGTVNAYVVGYYGAGAPHVRRLGGRPRNLAWSFQLTCVGGDDTKALWCVDEIRTALIGKRLDVEGRVTGLLREVGDTGPVRKDRGIVPHRFYLPLDFGLYV